MTIRKFFYYIVNWHDFVKWGGHGPATMLYFAHAQDYQGYQPFSFYLYISGRHRRRGGRLFPPGRVRLGSRQHEFHNPRQALSFAIQYREITYLHCTTINTGVLVDTWKEKSGPSWVPPFRDFLFKIGFLIFISFSLNGEFQNQNNYSHGPLDWFESVIIIISCFSSIVLRFSKYYFVLFY